MLVNKCIAGVSVCHFLLVVVIGVTGSFIAVVELPLLLAMVAVVVVALVSSQDVVPAAGDV